EGLRMLKHALAAADPFELALLDFQMPVMNGLDVLQEIRNTPELKTLPVIMLTSVDRLANITGRSDLAWSAYLTKPVKQSQLLDSMLEVMGKVSLETRDAQPQPQPEPAAADQAVTPLDILLVEDNEINRRLAKMALERAGHRVTLAENGKIALNRLAQETFDVALMDVQMPEMDGLEATAAIRANPRWAHLPVIAMTAHAMKGDRERFLAAGMDDYVSKPLRSQEVLAAIARQVQPAVNGNGNGGPAPQPEPELPPILNRKGVIEEFGGDEALFEELLELLISQARTQIPKMAQAIKAKDVRRLAHLVHSLKGSAGSIGAERLYDAAFDLEAASRSEDLPAAAAKLVALERQLALLVEFSKQPTG
ncbi:MAG: response regulator, partial [Anaerolineae bacterium]